MKKPQNCLFELRQSGGRRHDASSEPKCRAQPEAATICNHHKVFDLINQSSAALAVAVKGMMDLLDITPDQRELRLDGIRHLAVICPIGHLASSRSAGACLREVAPCLSVQRS